MGTVKIELDLSIVQEAIKTHTLSAVTAILDKHYDIPKMVENELLREPNKKEIDEHRMTSMMGMFYGARPLMIGKEMVEYMIKCAIQEQAEKYVKKSVKEQKKSLEDAFKVMMKKSPDRLVNAFLGAIESGVRNDWRFEIDTKVSVKEPERDYD